MSTSTPVKHVTEEEYLHNREYKHCEYVDGQVVPLNVGHKSHARITGKCYRKFDEYFDQHPGGYAAAELHCRLKIHGVTRYRLPDVAVVLGDELPDELYLHRSPDLAVEIRSPEDSITFLMRKADDYFANGARMVWIVLPEEKSVLVLAPSAAPQTFAAGESIDVSAVLPGLTIAVDDLFR
jgi:Uma2 family endonuclease